MRRHMFQETLSQGLLNSFSNSGLMSKTRCVGSSRRNTKFCGAIHDLPYASQIGFHDRILNQQTGAAQKLPRLSEVIF